MNMALARGLSEWDEVDSVPLPSQPVRGTKVDSVPLTSHVCRWDESRLVPLTSQLTAGVAPVSVDGSGQFRGDYGSSRPRMSSSVSAAASARRRHDAGEQVRLRALSSMTFSSMVSSTTMR